MQQDDTEALQARTRTLHAELEAERRSRSAAEAVARAARAAADEAERKLRRQDGEPDPIWRRHWSAVVVVVIAVVIGAVWMARARSSQARGRAEIKAASERAAKLHKQVEKCESAYDWLKGHYDELMTTYVECRTGKKLPSEVLEPVRAPHVVLSRAQIQAGMQAVKPRVQRCFDRYKVPGMANVQIRIMPSGRVATARTVGMFTGTPSGNCVQAAVRAARFPSFDGAQVTITYPFVLR